MAAREPLDPAVYSRVFESHPEGIQILEELVARFARYPIVTEGGIDAVLKTYENVGARKPIDFILNRINQSHGVNDDGQHE